MKSHSIVMLDFLHEGNPDETSFEIQDTHFTVVRHRIGWDFETAHSIIRAVDGSVDAIVLSGLNEIYGVGDVEVTHKKASLLIQAAQETGAYTGTELRRFFADWTLRKLFQDSSSSVLAGKRALFHCALLTPGLELMVQGGVNIQAADLLTLAGIPRRIDGLTPLKHVLRTVKPLLRAAPASSHGPFGTATDSLRQKVLRRWIAAADIFVTFRGLLDKIGDLGILKGKIVAIDLLEDDMKARLLAAGVGSILRLMPDIPALNAVTPNSFSLLNAVVDLLHRDRDDGSRFSEFMLRFIEEQRIEAKTVETVSTTVRKCAFIVHPLERRDIFRSPILSWIERTPDKAQEMLEKSAAFLPGFPYGKITGIRSAATGQEVECEIFALSATPKQMRALDEEFVYNRLVALAHQAKARGSAMIGLGAYTKVVGDAGTTVARRAPIPVTNGNSYSAASTLWAARVVVEQLGFVPKAPPGQRLRANAMVIGATGSIGRVSSHLLALVFDTLTLVGRRVERLLELREEIARLAPGVEVHLRTDPNPDLPQVDLIVTATSNDTGKVLDITRVKPGAVICDCSRPLDISLEDAALRPDVLVIESGEIDLPGDLKFTCDIGLPAPSVYACLAETVLLILEGRPEAFSLGKDLSLARVKEIYKLGLKHGAKLSAIRGPEGLITPERIDACRSLATERRADWNANHRSSAAEGVEVGTRPKESRKRSLPQAARTAGGKRHNKARGGVS